MPRSRFFLVLTLSSVAFSCGNLDVLTPSGTSGPFLYVASGTCYGGGVAVSTASNTITKFDLATGAYDTLLVDYNSFSPSDSPVGMVNYSSSQILVLVENASGRRIDLVDKTYYNTVTTYLVNSTAMSAQLRGIFMSPDGGLLVSKGTALEKFSSNKSRITSGANPFVSAPAGSCATSTTLISSMTTLSNGKILYAHAAATPNNKFGVIAATGYSVSADCLSSQTAPSTTALPTGIMMHTSGKILVAYGSTTAGSNYVYSYDINPTTNAISNTAVAFSDSTIINGPSAMALDSSSGNVYVANALSTSNTIEKFTYASGALTRVGTSPYIPSQIYTRCVTSMMVSTN